MSDINLKVTPPAQLRLVASTAPGATGPAGAQGIQGNAGPTGAAGPTGPAGANGTNGTNGTNGANAVPVPPQLRITLTSGVPTTESDVAGATAHFYSPAPGPYAPVTTDGVNFNMKFIGELSQDTTDATKSPAAVAANKIYDILLWEDSATVTMTIASPAVVSYASHGLRAGMPVIFTTSGALPTGVTAGQVYYVIAAGLTSSAFEFSATIGGAAVNTSGSQSGTHTITVERATRSAPWASDTSRGTGAGTPEVDFTTKIPTNKIAVTNGPAANRGVVVGAVRSDGTSQFNDTALLRTVSNVYNQAPRTLRRFEATASWTYQTNAWRQANAGAGTANKVTWLSCFAGMPTELNIHINFSDTDLGHWASVAVGLDSTTAPHGNNLNSLAQAATAGFNVPAMTQWKAYAGIGKHDGVWLEFVSGGTTGTFTGVNAATNSQGGMHGTMWG